jgi:hypothetical protein
MVKMDERSSNFRCREYWILLRLAIQNLILPEDAGGEITYVTNYQGQSF